MNNSPFFIIAIAIELGVPIFLAIWLTKRYKFGWGVVGVGVCTFIASQIIHIPLLQGLGYAFSALGVNFSGGMVGTILYGLYLGLMAGICEEPMRYLGFVLLKKRAKPAEAGILAGVGHGGIESIIIGVSVLSTFIAMRLASQGTAVPGITPDMVTGYNSTAWYLPLLGGLERITTIILHITLSMLVWRSVQKHEIAWLVLAIAYHMLVDSSAVILGQSGVNTILIEGVFVVFAVVNIWLLTRMKKNWKQVEPVIEALPEH
jgi:uncharacterized membrane protein YhfC